MNLAFDSPFGLSFFETEYRQGLVPTAVLRWSSTSFLERKRTQVCGVILTAAKAAM
jgi:hypothetical protein